MHSVQRQIVEYILSEVTVSGRVAIYSDYEGVVPLSQIEAMGHPEDARIGSRWYVWMLGRYPVTEYERLRRRVEIARELESIRADALSRMSRQDYLNAELLFIKIVNDYPKALKPSFALESAKLDLSTVYLRQGKNLKARQWALDVRNGTNDSAWRKKAYDFLAIIPEVNLKDAFSGKVVGVVCLRGEETGYTLDPDLGTSLQNRISAAGVMVMNMDLSLPQSVGPVDIAYITETCSTLASVGVDALIIVKLTTDSARTGKQQEEFGVVKDIIDSRMNYWVVRVHDGQVLAADQTVGYSKNIDAMLQVVLSHRRHLPMHAVRIADALQNAE